MSKENLKTLKEDAFKYLDAKLDELKIRATGGLSTAFGLMLTMMIIVILLVVVLIALSLGVALLVGKLVGNYTLGAFIVCGFFLILAVVVFLLRNKLFRNMFTKTFAGIFFNDGGEGRKDEI